MLTPMDAASFFLSEDEVQVWNFTLDRPPAAVERAAAVLSTEERARADAFHFPRDRIRFVIAHATLRELLGGYLQTTPAAVRFVAGPRGKPRLSSDLGPGGDVRFNLSHSHTEALLAVTRGREVGVDLEYMRAEVDCAGIVAGHFSPAEQKAWSALPESIRRVAFFHGWTRKEAYVKALGEGLAHEPRSYTVDLDPDGPGALLADDLIADGVQAWTVRALPAPAGYAAALAHAGSALRVSRRPLPE